MKKDQIEKAFRAGGAAPVLREKMGPYDLFMADSGLSHPPHFRFQRFGIEPGDFPRGMFATIWWLGMDEKLLIGRPMFFEPTEFRLEERLNAARKDAAKAFKRLRKH